MPDYYPTLEKLQRKTYPPYGKCIYCDETEGLTDEHIIPFGLGGTFVLPKASCSSCAAHTSRFEMAVLRGELWPVRVYRAMRSRRRHKNAPSSYPLVVERNGIEETVQLPIEKYPILAHFLDFSPPRRAIDMNSKPGIDVAGIVTVSFGPDPSRVLRDLGATSIKSRTSTHPVQFALMLAKIGYSMAAATGALSLIKGRSPIRDVILGRNSCVGDYVGTLTYPLSKHEDQLHRVIVLADTNSGQLAADIQLFSDSQAPRYGVLLGELA